MTQFNDWATRHDISPGALDELRAIMTQVNTEPSRIITGASEAAVQNAIRLEASGVGCRLWRNNVGACEDKRGRQIRYGLANDSSKMNGYIKSSDLIGIKPVLVVPGMVGSIIGQFVAREVKAGNWQYKATDREIAQLRFLELVIALGGDACFANGEGTL